MEWIKECSWIVHDEYSSGRCKTHDCLVLPLLGCVGENEERKRVRELTSREAFEEWWSSIKDNKFLAMSYMDSWEAWRAALEWKAIK